MTGASPATTILLQKASQIVYSSGWACPSHASIQICRETSPPVCYTAPDGNKNDCRDDGADNRHILHSWLTNNVKVEEADNQKDGEQSYRDCANNASRGTSAGDEFTDNTDQSRNN